MKEGYSGATENCLACSLKSPLFNFLTESELELVRDNKVTITFQTGETIRKQGMNMTHVLSLNSGYAKLYLEGNANRNAILRIVKATNFIGGPTIMLDQLHHFTITALTTTRVCFIEIGVFKQLMDRNKTFAHELTVEFNRHILSVYNRLLNMLQKKVPGKMADTLLYLSGEIFGQTHFPMYLSTRDLADLSGMSKESAVKILREFRQEGIIRMSGRIIHLLDVDSIKKISKIG